MPSLLPTEQLYEKQPLRPLSASTRSVPPLLTPLAVPGGKPSNVDKERTPDPLAIAKMPSSKSLVIASVETDAGHISSLAPPQQNDAPAPGQSFTERLAAKKASRVKGAESDSSRPSSALQEPIVPAVDTSKKHVQFDLQVEQVRQYTPEYSEEICKAVDNKSDSSSSEDFLDFVGDAGMLKPLSDLANYPIDFEEKRWDVSFSSFGVTSTPNGSPVKSKATAGAESRQEAVINADDDDEMITRFNSEYCPSPLPSNEPVAPQPMKNSQIAPITTLNINQNDSVRNNSAEEVDSSKRTSQQVPVKPVPVITSSFVNIPPQADAKKEAPQHVTTASESRKSKEAEKSKIDAIPTASEPTDDGTKAPTSSSPLVPARKMQRPNSLTRGITRSDSDEMIPSSSNVAIELPPPPPPSNATKEPSIDQSAKSVPHWNTNIDPAFDMSVINAPPSTAAQPPATSNQKIVIQVPAATIETPVKSSSIMQPVKEELPASSMVRLDDRNDLRAPPREEDWLLMKRQMELTLKDEKTKVKKFGFFSFIFLFFLLTILFLFPCVVVGKLVQSRNCSD